MMNDKPRTALDETLADNGLRMTRQRQLVYEVLIAETSHPTTEEVYRQVRKKMPSISLATVYNCLEKLVECNLVRQVNRDRDSSRFCGNLKEHGHFHCSRCGSIHDVDLTKSALTEIAPSQTTGFKVEQLDISFRGICPDCQNQTGSSN